MAHSPGPQQHPPDVWPLLIWLGQNAWIVMAGIVAWLINVLYQVLISKRNDDIDRQLSALGAALAEIKTELAELRGEMRARNK